ncbi:hypothetical protein CbuD7D7780_05440 [Coxiella burnetii]|uniref:Hypothetical cytosolic protein n=1 Tax=Coxiella burnetii (strain Dugway 5J108-111) TaxID=434922 RepID=A9KCD3_COXBN|nr:hypothetical protein [Coxiella burnetii]ABS77470.1 hypothetical cytosolic protein [Coxiella burnetii Dugway 5J108-111]OYK82288.1 hypothetical protein CbuD7D7780_05440 [Coxiella burnetii]
MRYPYGSALTKRAFAPIFPPNIDLSQLGEPPQDWLACLIQICGSGTEEYFDKHIGKSSTFAHKERLIHKLKIIYHRLNDHSYFIKTLGPLSHDGRVALVSKLTEDIGQCTPGFDNRTSDIVRSFTESSSFPELMTIVREELVKEVSLKMGESVGGEVHSNNRVFVIAAEDEYGVRPINQMDVYPGRLSDRDIREELRIKFRKEFTPFRLPFLLSKALQDLLSKRGYTGKKKGNQYYAPVTEAIAFNEVIERCLTSLQEVEEKEEKRAVSETETQYFIYYQRCPYHIICLPPGEEKEKKAKELQRKIRQRDIVFEFDKQDNQWIMRYLNNKMKVDEIKVEKEEHIDQLNIIYNKANNPKEMEIENIQDRRIINAMVESLGLTYLFDAHWYPIDINWLFIQERLFSLLVEQGYFNKSYFAPQNLFDCVFIRSVLLKPRQELRDSFYKLQSPDESEDNPDPLRRFSMVLKSVESDCMSDFWGQGASLSNSLSEIRSNFPEYFDWLMKKDYFLKSYIDRCTDVLKEKIQNGFLFRIGELFQSLGQLLTEISRVNPGLLHQCIQRFNQADDGYNLLMLAVRNPQPEAIEAVLQYLSEHSAIFTPDIVKEMFLLQDNAGRNVLTLSVQSTPQVTRTILKFMSDHSEAFDTETLKRLFLATDVSGKSILMLDVLSGHEESEILEIVNIILGWVAERQEIFNPGELKNLVLTDRYNILQLVPLNLSGILNRIWGFVTNQPFLNKIGSGTLGEMLTRTNFNQENILISALCSSQNKDFANAILKFITDQPEVLSDDKIKNLFFQKDTLYKKMH